MKIQTVDLKTGEWNTVLEGTWFRIELEDGEKFDISSAKDDSGLSLNSQDVPLMVIPRSGNALIIYYKPPPKYDRIPPEIQR